MAAINAEKVQIDYLPVPANAPGAARRLPITLKILYTAFVAVLVPFYWKAYSPWNFLYFCDLALLETVIALWTENSLLASQAAVMILLPQTLWILDLTAHFGGLRINGMTDYMFDPGIPLFTRLLSSFHGWLPVVLVFMVWRLGYDRRALALQLMIGAAVLLVSYYIAPHVAPPYKPNMATNLNYVLGLGATPQTRMSAVHWLMLVASVILIGFYVPTHFALRAIMPRKNAANSR